MGLDTRRPILPAPTESLVDTPNESVTGTDLATDLSRRTDKTSYSIPDDGSPVTVSTRRRDRDDKLSRSHRDSQTSLLIEYFEGGKGTSGIVSRPSVRVRVTPSGARKSKDKDHIQITESGSSRKPSYTRRISLTSPSSKPKQLADSNLDDQSLSDSNSVDEGGNHHPVEIEFMNRDIGSELSTVSRDRYMMPASDISSMPADSMLEGASSAGPRRKRSQSLERGASRDDKNLLKTPSRQRSRSLSHERIAHRVAEKLTGSPQETSSGKKSSRRSKTRSSGKDYLDAEPTKPSSRRKRHGDDEYIPSPESSLLSTSNVSSNRKSDAYSVRSGASKSSINNPKLLETVEDAIRRLILPELKELKKDQKVISNTSKFDRDMTTSYSSASSRDELGRRLSKHASAPDVMKPKVVLNKDSKDEGIVLSGDSVNQNKERKSSKSSETSDAAWVKWGRPELSEQEKLRRQKSKGLRDAQAAGRVGSALTAASLKHHDSQSSLGNGERRASGSQKSIGGYNETELVFQKHNVPAMPMRSEIDSELTRASLLSERTESPTPRKKLSQAEISRGSPRQVVSPTSRTPTRTPLDSRYELGMRHANQSQRDLSMHSASDRDLRAKSQSPGTDGDWAIAAAAAANLLDAAQPSTRDSYAEQYEAGRALSPIQSVASERTETHDDYYQNKHHAEVQREMEPRLSIDSLSSAPSTNLARSTRQDGVSPHSQSRFSHNGNEGPELGYEHSRHASAEGGFYGHDEEESRLNDSVAVDDSEVDFMDRVKEGQHVAPAIAANPQFIHPIGVESAVASLMDPSILDTQSNNSTNRSPTELAPRSASRSPEKYEARRGSPLKQRQDASTADETSFTRRMGATSPPQSVTQSVEDLEDAGIAAAAARGIGSPLREADNHSQEDESEINTNPSIIQGPGVPQPAGDHWGYDSRSPPAGQAQYYDSSPAGGAKDLGAAPPHNLDAEYYETARNIFGGDDYYPDQQSQQLFGTPPGAKDEGYVSAAHPGSPSVGTPKQGSRGLGPEAFASPGEEDALSPGHQRHFSGYSHGVGSPLYDSATGHGIERIKSKDIVALMDHLTVRDAQRNARDTEMLVTLVRSAAEMRTSFDEMKKFIAMQDELLMSSNNKGHEQTRGALGGPRPLPPSGSRTRQLNTLDEDEDLQSKRKNIFKRALKGLSLKSGNDLSKIEGMLEQLLDEVEALREGRDVASPRAAARAGSFDSNAFDANAQTGTGSPHMASPSRQNTDPRVSTVPEEDEDDELDENDAYMTAHLPVQQPRHERAGSLPLATPPRKPLASGTRSNDTTPKASADKAEKARKHKSSSSSIFPKISRWSKTTASSMGDNIRNSIQPGRKERPYSENLSRTGSDLAQGAYKGGYYDPEGDDRIRSHYSLDDDDDQENRPPSPLVPSNLSEQPKYEANRASIEIQHPQPRQGPTGRYQSALESQAQSYNTPVSPTSDQWGSNPSLPVVQPNNRYSGGSRLSPISDAGYSEGSSRVSGPPRPPKIRDNGPLVPERPPKIPEDESQAMYAGDRVSSRSSAIRSPPTRKPTGPRPLTSGGSYSGSPSNIKRTRYRGSPDQIDDEDDY